MNRIILAVAALCMSAVVFAAETDAYIESTGVAGIDTGYRVKPNTRIAVDFAFTTTEQTVGARVFGADYNHTVLKTAFSFYIGDNTDYGLCGIFGFGDAVSGWHTGLVKDKSGNPPIVDLDRHTVEYDFPGGRYTYYTNGEAKSWQTDDPNKYTEESTGSVTLFSTKDNSGKERPSKARIYGVKIYEKIDDEYVLVRDFRPVKIDGVPGFECRVSGYFAGAGMPSAFLVGGECDVRESPYVATSMTNYDGAQNQTKHHIDTQYYATESTRCELDFALRVAPVSGKASWLFCGGSGSGGVFGICSKNGTFLMSNGNGWPSVSATQAVETDVRRTAILDNVSDCFYLVTAGVTNIIKKANASKGDYSANPIRIGTYFNGLQEYGALKVYGLKIYESGVLVRDFRPLWKDGITGLEDRKTGLFVYCPEAKDATIEHGGEIKKAEFAPFVETDLTYNQYIDTGYTPQKTTRCEVEYAPTAAYSSGTWYVFCGRNSSVWGAYLNGSGFGWYNSSWKSGTVALSVAKEIGVRRIAVVDNLANSGALITGCFTNGVTTVSANNTGTLASDLSIKLSTKHDANGEFGSFRFYACRIYEADVLQHEYLPTVKADGSVGLQDTKSETFLPVLSKTATNPQVYGGAFKPTITPSTTKLCVGKSVVLTATAPGAGAYRWLKNGTPISGGENGSLTVEWCKGCETDAYQAITIVTVDGVDGEGEVSSAVTVENLMAPFVISIR